MIDGHWREVGESRKLPHICKWTLVENGQDGFIGVVDRLSIVGIGGFLSRKRKFGLTREPVASLYPTISSPTVATRLL
jgi:hypothetical protein